MARKGPSTERTNALGKRLKELRLNLSWSQEQLAKKVGLQQKQISSYERGSSTPSGEVFIALADAFDVSLDYLAQRTSRRGPQSPLADLELLERAQQIDRMNANDRLLVKHMMDLVILKQKFKELAAKTMQEEHLPQLSVL